jgi:hypothetical protein
MFHVEHLRSQKEVERMSASPTYDYQPQKEEPPEIMPISLKNQPSQIVYGAFSKEKRVKTWS